ncbi:hypothetical protein LNQ03_11570 [Klebsiella pneumoniae subsp. pneumoniae]|nr:hypothetical protein [Klebsiella pneumoniae subsp. pneumoniae]
MKPLTELDQPSWRKACWMRRVTPGSRWWSITSAAHVQHLPLRAMPKPSTRYQDVVKCDVERFGASLPSDAGGRRVPGAARAFEAGFMSGCAITAKKISTTPLDARRRVFAKLVRC